MYGKVCIDAHQHKRVVFAVRTFLARSLRTFTEETLGLGIDRVFWILTNAKTR